MTSLPRSFKVLARSKRCLVHAFRLEGAPIFGVQAHPEINPGEGERLLADFAPRFPEMKKHPVFRPFRDTGLVETIMKNFLEMS